MPLLLVGTIERISDADGGKGSVGGPRRGRAMVPERGGETRRRFDKVRASAGDGARLAQRFRGSGEGHEDSAEYTSRTPKVEVGRTGHGSDQARRGPMAPRPQSHPRGTASKRPSTRAAARTGRTARRRPRSGCRRRAQAPPRQPRAGHWRFPHQSRNDERKPCTVESMPSVPSSVTSVMAEMGRPGRALGNTRSERSCSEAPRRRPRPSSPRMYAAANDLRRRGGRRLPRDCRRPPPGA